tara:strand:- start:1888 stop:2082 length:195 start_codon:yes stop_codon:yes gene_type:complete
MKIPPKANHFHRIVIKVFQEQRTVPKTIKEIERLSGKEYKSHSFIRSIVREYRKHNNDSPRVDT